VKKSSGASQQTRKTLVPFAMFSVGNVEPSSGLRPHMLHAGRVSRGLLLVEGQVLVMR
jgi:hypothetical protein